MNIKFVLTKSLMLESFKSRTRTIPFFRKFKTLIMNFQNIQFSQPASILRHLNSSDITTIIDVGANVGQFGIDMRSSGFAGKIFSFEPVTEIYDVLQKRSWNDSNWSVHKIGLGANEGVSNINVSMNAGLSSSILKMNGTHEAYFPNSITKYTEEILLSTLDIQISSLEINPSNCLLKIDVQGFEYEVLMGALSNLPKIPMVLLEISITPFYVGEKDLVTLLEVLRNVNHNVIDIYRGIQSRSGNLLQIDVLTSLRK